MTLYNRDFTVHYHTAAENRNALQRAQTVLLVSDALVP